MIEKTLVLKNEDGLHARPAGIFVKKAMQFQSQIELEAGGIKKNAKSLMGLMTLGLEKDAEIKLIAKGEDAEAALEALSQLIEGRFSEAHENN